MEEWILLQKKIWRWDGGFMILVEHLGEVIIGDGAVGDDISGVGISSMMVGGQMGVSGIEDWESEETGIGEKYSQCKVVDDESVW